LKDGIVHFGGGAESTEDEQHSGRPSTLTTEEKLVENQRNDSRKQKVNVSRSI
jgi:hypothetical protein